MHRTTTTATLLVTVAFSALSGCMTVQSPPAPGPAMAPSRPSVPRPDGRAETQIVQAPAREALEMIAPSRKPEPTAPATPAQRRRTAAAPAEQPPAPRSRPHSRPPHPAPRRHAPPRVELPDVEAEVRRNTDVCALGRKYGGWRQDSPEAVICEQAYGR
ncbi:hypothetical protein [Streptomyces sp. NPDC050263]|uniref:hypothetical protein n=1 Tax=Streptomyces sp. NPDC050263 TaxID=3155037 RepID=UPI00343CD14D